MNNASMPQWQIDAFEHRLGGMLERKKDFHAFAIITGQGPIYQRVYNGYQPEVLHPLFSITKSLTVWLAHLACYREGVALESSIVDLLPREDWPSLIGQNPYLSELKLSHLMNMQAGFDWQEVQRFYEEDNPFRAFLRSGDPAGYLLKWPMAVAPGSEVVYNSAVSHLLGLCVKAIAGKPLKQLAQALIFEPLGIQNSAWESDCHGDAYGGHGLSMDFHGLMALGQLLAGQGRYAGQEVIPSAVMEALQVPVVKSFRGYEGYGHGMWHVHCGGETFVAAFGHGGQRIYWHPQGNYALAFLGAVKPEFGLQEQLIQQLLKAQ